MEIQLPFESFILLKYFSELLTLLKPAFNIVIKRYEIAEKIVHYKVTEFWNILSFVFGLLVVDTRCLRQKMGINYF